MSRYVVRLNSKEIVTKWWSQSWCKNISQYADYENRLLRGKRYLRQGAVQNLIVENGKIFACVYGSRLDPYEVFIKISPLSPKAKKEAVKYIQDFNVIFQEEINSEMGFLYSMGEKGLFPTIKEIEFSCTCPDDALMCKHIAAVLYAMGCVLDKEPLLLFKLRGIDIDLYLEKDLQDKANKLLSSFYNEGDNRIDLSEVSRLFGVKLKSLDEDGWTKSIMQDDYDSETNVVKRIEVGQVRDVKNPKNQRVAWYNNEDVPKGMVFTGANVKKYIGEDCFVKIPTWAEKIGRRAFSYCRNLQTVEVPKSVKKIEERAFEGCENLVALSLPNDIEEIGEGAFSYCKSLKEINIPNKVVRIKSKTFAFCESLESVRVPKGIKEFAEDAFLNSEIRTIYYEGDVNSWFEIDGVNNFTNMNLYINGESVTDVKEISIPQNITELKSGVFSCWKGLESVIIPKHIKKLGVGVFAGCDNLSKLIVECCVDTSENKFSRIVGNSNSKIIYDLRENSINILSYLTTRLLSIGCFLRNIEEGVYYSQNIIEENNNWLKSNKMIPRYALGDVKIIQYMLDKEMIDKKSISKLVELCEQKGYVETKEVLLNHLSEIGQLS